MAEEQKYSCKFARMLQRGETKPYCYVLGYGECQYLCEVGQGGGKYHFILHTLKDCADALITISIGESIKLPVKNISIYDLKTNCEFLLSKVEESQVFKVIFDIKTAILKIADKIDKRYNYPLDNVDDYIYALKGISQGEAIPLNWNKEDIDEIIMNCYVLANNVNIQVYCDIRVIDDIPDVIRRIMAKLNEGKGGYPQYPYCQIYWAYKDLEPLDTVNT